MKRPRQVHRSCQGYCPNIRRYQLGRHQSTRMFRNRTPPERGIGHPRDARRPARHRHHLQRRIAERPGSGRQEDRGSEIVVNGAGASATSCTKLYEALGARRENILMLDSKGVITSDRENLTEQKRYFATDRRDVHTLAEAIKGADVFLGLSKVMC